MRGRGARLDRDLETFADGWRGESVGGGPNAAVPTGTRKIPMLLRGFAPAVMERMARWAHRYIGGPFPTEMTSASFEAAKAAWNAAGRDGLPRLITLPYLALGDPDTGRANIGDYYAWTGAEAADMVAGVVCGSADAIKAAVDS
jgi:hypothetical protein